jgi:hypothetical protein
VLASKTLTIESGGTFTYDGTSAFIYGTLGNDGTVLVLASKTLTIESGGTFTYDGTSAFIYGTLTNDGTVTVNASKTLTINSGGTFTHNGTSASIYGTLSNNGTVTVNASKTLTINSGGTFTHNGTSAAISGTLDNNGMVTVNASKTLTQMSGGTITHNGTLKGEGTISTVSGSFSNPAAGTLSPGNSPGCFNFSNGLSNSGTVVIEVNGTTACTQFDRITVTGTATLGGTLNVSIGYTPTNGDVITFLYATSISGTFSIVSALPSGWSLAYDSPSAGKVSLQYSLLPVELVSFQTEKQNDHTVVLTWRTASEQNNEGFDIERSSDGRNWETLGFVPGNGTTHEEQSYAFTDGSPLPGVNYYRLRQVDFDGQYEYSEIESALFDGGTGTGIHVYPNPVKDGLLNINFATEQEGAAALRLFDASDKMLHRETLANQYNQTGYGHLPAGMYFIEVTTRKDVWRERLIVQ